MMETTYQQALKALETTFKDRLRRPGTANGEAEGGALASVLPLHTEEVIWLSEVAARYALRLVPVGAGTGSKEPHEENGILVRFDFMSGIRLPDEGEEWVEAQPGTPWLKLDNELRRHGRGLAVYPTSAPRATVGGWLATDGLGVGSFEYGRLRENVISASVVGRGGGLREIGRDELDYRLGPGGVGSVVVGARLRTRRADADRTFAAAFEEPGEVAGAVAELVESAAPLWHLGFVNPVMANARGLGTRYVLFGAYPDQRGGEAWEGLRRRVLEAHSGIELDSREALQVWGERFFPVAPSHPTPGISREFVPLQDLQGVLQTRSREPLQGTVSGSGEILVLTLWDHASGSAQP